MNERPVPEATPPSTSNLLDIPALIGEVAHKISALVSPARNSKHAGGRTQKKNAKAMARHKRKISEASRRRNRKH
jgi:hypothetical protein